MKYTMLILSACLLLPILVLAQGSSCSSPYTLTLDGAARTYAASSSTGASVLCTAYTATSPVTWFSFTTNASGQTPLLDITAKDGNWCEIAMYTGCNMSRDLLTSSSMCFDDGEGLWAPAQNYTVSPNTTYYLRVKTASATEIKVSAQNYTPLNNNCIGATSVDANFIKDNNATHKPSTEVTNDQICAITIENTAFYQFYVASTGSAVININNIACDNGNLNNNTGFQIGFFTGSCGALVNLSCTSGNGTFVQGTTPVLSAGTKVFVAIDGQGGSNCQYSIQALNAYGVLAQGFSNFSGWKNNSSNIIKWTSTNDVTADYYEIERSLNNNEFKPLGRINRTRSGERSDYSFEDRQPFRNTLYRIRQVSIDGKIALSDIIKIDRNEIKGLAVNIVNPATNDLTAYIESASSGKIQYSVIDMSGHVYIKDMVNCNAGITQIKKLLSHLPVGKYILKIDNSETSISKLFIKLNN